MNSHGGPIYILDTPPATPVESGDEEAEIIDLTNGSPPVPNYNTHHIQQHHSMQQLQLQTLTNRRLTAVFMHQVDSMAAGIVGLSGSSTMGTAVAGIAAAAVEST
ncbi:hypothetical protein NADE_005011 [Nannochloris sp. 'desiccata']|nr:hypothetical protein NADE_005011 [Chlorella desiccata (nom. nud.)]